MKLFTFIKVGILSSTILMSCVKATDTVGIVASISPQQQTAISFAVDTCDATKMLVDATNHPKSDNIYWFNRNASDTYHVTLDLLGKSDKTQFADADLNHVELICQNFNNHAQFLKSNQKKTGKKAYVGNGYELRLFVHYTDGTHEQFKSATIGNLIKSSKDVAYANIVLKLGTHGGLMKDWLYTRNKILAKPNHSDLIRTVTHDLETHITIGTLYKYSKQQNHIVGNQVLRNNGKNGFNTPFLCSSHEMKLLVGMFAIINQNLNQNALQGIHLDRLQITGKDQTGKIKVLREVVFK